MFSKPFAIKKHIDFLQFYFWKFLKRYHLQHLLCMSKGNKMIRKLIKKIQNKELIEYISWKFGIKKLVNRFSNNYWGVGDNYNWIFDLLSTEDINYTESIY